MTGRYSRTPTTIPTATPITKRRHLKNKNKQATTKWGRIYPIPDAEMRRRRTGERRWARIVGGKVGGGTAVVRYVQGFTYADVC